MKCALYVFKIPIGIQRVILNLSQLIDKKGHAKLSEELNSFQKHNLLWDKFANFFFASAFDIFTKDIRRHSTNTISTWHKPADEKTKKFTKIGQGGFGILCI